MNFLIIDDNPQIVHLLSKILENKGHQITSANLLDEGIKLASSQTFDAFIVDAPLPGYEKLQVVDELEKNGMLSSKKIILFTALDIPNSAILELKTRGLYSYLKKPLEAEKIVQELSLIPSIKNSELSQKIISEEQTKKKFEDLRSNLSSLKFKLSPT